MAGTKVDVEGNNMAAEQTQETTKTSRSKSTQSFNQYATKKTLASGLLDIGLLMANASQLKALLDVGKDGQDYYYPLLVLIALSIVLQVTVGVIFLVLGSLEVKTEEEKRHVHVLNDVTVGFIFAVTILNVFIGAFGIKLSSGNK